MGGLSGPVLGLPCEKLVLQPARQPLGPQGEAVFLAPLKPAAVRMIPVSAKSAERPVGDGESKV